MGHDVYETEMLIATTENVYLFIMYHMPTLNNVNIINFMRFIVIMAVTKKNTLFWNVTPCIWYMFLRNSRKLLPDYTVSHIRIEDSSI